MDDYCSLDINETQLQNTEEMRPIGYVKSPFLFKNGTPRQPSVCKHARGIITIEKSIFNNPEHSLEGLQDFTHVWILFIFHQNNNSYTKAKVKPPRLNGKRVGLFSTRSPYRPNNIGLTLAKIEQIQGASLTVSGIDMIDGTPVIDIKPYIGQYDCPSKLIDDPVYQENFAHKLSDDSSNEWADNVKREAIADFDNVLDSDKGSAVGVCDSEQEMCAKADNDRSLHCVKVQSNETTENQFASDVVKNDEMNLNFSQENDRIVSDCIADKITTQDEVDSRIQSVKNVTKVHCNGQTVGLYKTSGTEKTEYMDDDKPSIISRNIDMKEESSYRSADWIEKPPISSLSVRFTPTALKQLVNFNFESDNKMFKMKMFQNTKDAKSAIISILSEDPRSTYRRKHCEDSLYYFTIDVIHVTSWFDDDTHTAEVVRIKPASLVEHCKHKFSA